MLALLLMRLALLVMHKKQTDMALHTDMDMPLHTSILTCDAYSHAMHTHMPLSTDIKKQTDMRLHATDTSTDRHKRFAACLVTVSAW